MMRKNLLPFFMAFFVSYQASASSFQTCTYHVKIKNVSDSEVSVEVLKLLESEGFSKIGDALHCKSKLLNGKIPLKKVAGKKDLIKKGSELEVQWMSYGGMGSEGPVSGISWTFSRLR